MEAQVFIRLQYCHFPKFRNRANILSWLGLYTENYIDEHVFLHHSYTNTQADTDFIAPYQNKKWNWFTLTFVIIQI